MDVVARTHGTLRRLPLGLFALVLALGLWVVPARADESELAETPEVAAAEAAPEPELAAAADDEPWDEGEDPFVRDGIANIDELPWDLYVDGGADTTVEMVLDFAAIGVPEGTEPNVRIEVGHYLWDNEEMPWGETITIDGLATYDATTRTITLDGTKLAGEDGTTLVDGIYANAFVTWGEEGAETLRIAGAIFGVERGNQYGARVWLDPNGRENRVYSGSTAAVHVGAENPAAAEAAGNKVIVFVGRWFGHPDFTTAFTEGEGYTYDAASGTVTLDGTWLAEQNLDHVDVFALIAPEPAAGETFGDDYWDAILALDVASFDVRTPRESYDNRVYDDTMLPGWEWDVQRWYDLDLDTSEHPDNEPNHPDHYEVTNVAVAEQRRWDEDAQDMVSFPYEEGSDDNVVNVWKSTWTYTDDDGTHDDWNWRYRAENYGEARLTVTYLDVDGNEQSYDFCIWVGSDRYNVDVQAADNVRRVLPGSSVTLFARGWHDRDGEQGDYRDEELRFAWQLDGGATENDLASITWDGDGSVATLTFKDAGALGDDVRRDLRVEAVLSKRAEGDDDFEEVRRGDIWLTVASDFEEIWAPGFDRNLGVGTALALAPELRHYPADGEPGYTVADDVHFRVEDYDDNRLDVDNDTLTVTRKNGEDADFQLVAYRTDGQGHELEVDRKFFRFDHLDYDVRFEGDDHARLYADQSLTLTADTESLVELNGVTLDWTVGVADDHGGFPYRATTGFVTSGNTITLDGAALFADQQIREHGGANVCVRAMLGDQELSDAWCWVELREPREEYDREGDRDMLPGWGDDGNWRVDRWHHMEVDTAAHPDDEEDHPWDYEVTDVTTSDASIVKVTKETWVDDQGNDDWNWRYQAVACGEADLTVSYRDIDGQPQSYSFHVRVQDIVYHLDRWFDRGSDTCLPGQSLTVGVQAVQDREQGGGIIEGFAYSWEVLEGAEWLEGDLRAEGNQASVTFKNAPEGETDYRRGVRVHVTATKGELVLQEDFWLNCEQRYPELVLVDGAGHAVSLDGDLAEGASVTVTPKIYYHGASPEEQAITELVWHFDENFARIVDADGNEVHDSDRISTGTFTITRTGGWRSSIDLEATWHDDDFEWDGGNRQEHLSWYFQALGASKYDVWFSTDAHATAYAEDDWGNKHPVVYDDNELSLTLMADSLGVDDYSIVWEVGDDYDWEHDAWNEGATLLDSGYVTDGDTITLAGSGLPSWGGYIVRAQVKRDAETLYTLAEWIERKESCTSRGLEHVWADRDVFKQPTTEEVGAKTEFCRDCGEVRVVEVPRLRINISGATVTVAKATYTGKALSPAVTVKLGGATLRKGIDYTVKYANNVKAGTKTASVTITGIGKYQGSKTVKFTIAKAKNTLVAKLVKKTQTAKIGETTKIKTAKAFKVTKNVSKGKVTYKKLTGDKKITISKAGVVTVKKGLKKGTYKVKVRLTSAATANYLAASKDLVLTIKVK